MPADGLWLGVASVDITPPVGIPMGGYWGRRSGAVDVHDPLMGRVLVFRQDGKESRGALITLDLIGLDAQTVRDLRQRIQERTPIAGAAVMVCCTHTHSGPLTLPFRGMGDMDDAYLNRMLEQVADAVLEASHSAMPVQASYARTAVRIGVNRRQDREGKTVIGQNPRGPVAAYAHVIRFDSTAGLRAVLFSHACHGTVLGAENHRISADFAGAAVRYVEARTGTCALFVNGACGDINPRETGAGFAAVEALGAELGAAVVAAMPATRPVPGAQVRRATAVAQLPLLAPPPRWRAQWERLVLQFKSRPWRFRSRRGDVWRQLAARARLDWAEESVARSRQPARCASTQPFEVQALALGELAFLGLEGEIFVRYQLDMEGTSPLRHTVVCGYANGCIGYVPTADEYGRGGYEIDTAYKVYPSVAMIAAESEAIIRRCAARVLEEVCGNDRPASR